MPVFKSQRLAIRPLQVSDVDDAHEIFSDPRVFEFFGKGIRTRQQIEASTVRIAEKWKKENRGDFAVCLGSKMIGQMLVLENDEKEFELGYVFNPSFWGQVLFFKGFRGVKSF